MLLPCDLREWVPADHIVHFIIDAVAQTATGHFKVNDRGTGSPQYPPAMVLTLLIYCYATGRFGSRTIEQATYDDVAVRYLCANLHPDHATLCAFRTDNEAAFQAAFVTVLQLAQALRLTRVGNVSVDGTKIQANASKHKAVSYQRAGEMIAQLQLEVQALTQRAAQADTEPVPATLDLPAELARRDKRLDALKGAREVIEARAKAAAAAQQTEYAEKAARRAAQRAAGKTPRGPEPVPPSDTPDPKAQYNFTDPESRIMKAGNGPHFEQAYNAQAAVDEHLLIVGAQVCAAPNDKEQLAPTVAAISPVVAGEVKNILVDSGFYSEAGVRAVEQTAGGEPTGRTVYAAVAKGTHHQTVADLLPPPEPAAPAPTATAKTRMAHRLQTAAGKSLYKLRKQTVEPVFGIIKEVMGFRRFHLRGKAKVGLEWTLVCVSYNLKRLFTLKNQAAAS
jgi:transposase